MWESHTQKKVGSGVPAHTVRARGYIGRTMRGTVSANIASVSLRILLPWSVALHQILPLRLASQISPSHRTSSFDDEFLIPIKKKAGITLL